MIKKIITIGAAISLLAASSLPAFAVDPSAQASCMGQEAAAISPPGSSEEFPDGMPGLKAFIDTIPVPPGTIFNIIAKLHEGSHEACDEALE
ncbi:hypothetical protein A2899_00760 [Candidatus Amesbacteria bacterium RIFCSPLOWO2_01_FULL_49_25]|uniref:Uncharacterized protein n=1 Tax=Candidatus Amesbacteria bacterium RIFCSPHIGHO2_01_FULL_48_32b TaxID=1797253 RepID=A0A1F4YEU9_9BACT|nr:MAG: hypothetical protein A2876_01485 [Candidatus Amesbacteria bacterium RIFCSPHIGHO2_01_FULL_48_32b]OGD08038.1 MAG: hypothetical protein A2899_00760 [Candidatus Amesbacteria bacterium RIFCSPLOWO2_01_FULL_49_25]